MLPIVSRLFSRSGRIDRRQKSPGSRRKPLRFESLEDRQLLAFGAAGIVIIDMLPNASDRIESLVVQPDGKIVAAGGGGVVRYNVDGSLDSSFNNTGTVPVPFSLTDVALQADGKILVGGQQNADMMLRRYNVNGSLDSTFSGDGLVLTDFKNGSRDEVATIALQPPDPLSGEQKIVVAGFHDTGFGGVPTWSVLRYHANGTLDNSFDRDGKLTTTFGKGNSKAVANSVLVQPDGRILVVGSAIVNNGFFDFAMARYLADGALDSSFGRSGKVTTDFNARSDQAFDVALRPDGKIVVAGKADSLIGLGQGSLARYNANGSLDSGFGQGGKVEVTHPPTFGNYNQFTGISLSADGRITVGGGWWSPVVTRLLSSGSLDMSFDGDGTRVFEFGPEQSDPHHRGLAVQSDGKILV
ncbi:MAG: hypothetical protein SGJ19_01125 [Planctomycetia bacterium]|nr:hypothetical protein [Planctomycetia bacterium]